MPPTTPPTIGPTWEEPLDAVVLVPVGNKDPAADVAAFDVDVGATAEESGLSTNNQNIIRKPTLEIA